MGAEWGREGMRHRPREGYVMETPSKKFPKASKMEEMYFSFQILNK